MRNALTAALLSVLSLSAPAFAKHHVTEGTTAPSTEVKPSTETKTSAPESTSAHPRKTKRSHTSKSAEVKPEVKSGDAAAPVVAPSK